MEDQTSTLNRRAQPRMSKTGIIGGKKYSVFARLRPSTENGSPTINPIDGTCLRTEYACQGSRTAEYSKVFTSTASQKQIFEGATLPLLDEFLERGTDVVLLSYGTPASGKTYTLFGEPKKPGIIPRALLDIFSRYQLVGSSPYRVDRRVEAEARRIFSTHGVTKFSNSKPSEESRQSRKASLWLSATELTGDTGVDLLAMRTNSTKGDIPKGELQIPVRNIELASKVLSCIASNRRKTQTRFGTSISHLIFTMTLIDEGSSPGTTRFVFVDLAGCGRKPIGVYSQFAFKPLVQINQELKAIIQALELFRSGADARTETDVNLKRSLLIPRVSQCLSRCGELAVINCIDPAVKVKDETLKSIESTARSVHGTPAMGTRRRASNPDDVGLPRASNDPKRRKLGEEAIVMNEESLCRSEKEDAGLRKEYPEIKECYVMVYKLTEEEILLATGRAHVPVISPPKKTEPLVNSEPAKQSDDGRVEPDSTSAPLCKQTEASLKSSPDSRAVKMDEEKSPAIATDTQDKSLKDLDHSLCEDTIRETKEEISEREVELLRVKVEELQKQLDESQSCKQQLSIVADELREELKKSEQARQDLRNRLEASRKEKENLLFKLRHYEAVEQGRDSEIDLHFQGVILDDRMLREAQTVRGPESPPRPESLPASPSSTATPGKRRRRLNLTNEDDFVFDSTLLESIRDPSPVTRRCAFVSLR